jgi:glycosyltransferase involved in cell wall biosynthesis
MGFTPRLFRFPWRRRSRNRVELTATQRRKGTARLISVVIPTYNRAQLLPRALGSVLAQTRSPDEVIVVDDGSTDDTARVVARYGRRVTYIYKDNGGASAARNRGVDSAAGEFVAFLDSDDLWRPRFLEQIEHAIDETGERALAYFADLSYSGKDATCWQLAGFGITGRCEFRQDPTNWFLLPRQPMTTQATVIRRSAYLKLGGQDDAMLCREDTHLFLRLGFAGPACAVAYIGAELTPDGGQDRLTQIHPSDSPSYWRETIHMYADVLHRCQNVPSAGRRVLRARLAVAYWRTARLASRNHQPWQFVRALAAALATSPVTILTHVTGVRRRRAM